jgi:hypothetical protein
MRRKIQIPDPDAGTFDAQPKSLISRGIVGRWMWCGGQVPPSLYLFLQHTLGFRRRTLP